MRGRQGGGRGRGPGRNQGKNMSCTPLPIQLFNLIFSLIQALIQKLLGRQITDTIPNTAKLNEQEKEKAVLKIANEKNGRLTIAEVAMDTSLSLEESKTILEKMSADGVAELQITDGGSLVYVFTGLISEKEKATAKEPLLR